MRISNLPQFSVRKQIESFMAISMFVGMTSFSAIPARAAETGNATVVETSTETVVPAAAGSEKDATTSSDATTKAIEDAAAAANKSAVEAATSKTPVSETETQNKVPPVMPKAQDVTVAPTSSQKNLEVTGRCTYEDYLKWKAKPKAVAPKVGLALGGGGARGAAHVGVLEVLLKEGIKFDYIAGTSIGSVVGGMHAAGVPIKKVQNDFESGALMKHFMTVSLPTRIMLAPILYVPRLLGAKPYDGLYNGAKFRTYLDKNLPTDGKKIENLKIPFAAVALNVLNGKPYMIRGGELGYAMQASCAVPGLRKPVQIGEKLFVDGGVVCNLPVKQVRQMGADIVIAVNIDEPFYEDKLETFRKPGSVTRRMLKWDLYTIDGPQEDIADVVIHPNTEDVSLITTNKNLARRAFEEGQKAAREALPQIREKLKNVELVGKEDKDS